MSAEPTARPWAINRMTWASSDAVLGWHITNDIDGSITPVLSSEISIGGMRDQEVINLKHAVDCVNVHDELVAALEIARAEIIICAEPAFGNVSSKTQRTITRIDEALAKARGSAS